ncbi:MAG: universal stress protein [Myxococcaceae bacterium]
MPSRSLLSSVVVPTDFSEGAQHAVERVMRLPLAPKSKVTLLHVLPDDIPGKLRKEALAEAERSLEKSCARAAQLALSLGVKAQVVCDVVEGSAAEQIVKRAHTVEADLVCMGRHGRRSLVNMLLGSVAAKTIRIGDVPVLLVKHAPVNAYRRVVIAVDLQKGSDKVLKVSRPFVEEALDLSVLSATSVPYEEFVMLETGRADELRAEATRDAQKQLSALISKVGLVRAEAMVLPGDARVLILEQARTRAVELIVVGTRGLTGVKRLVLGSVAEWVLQNATTDVLVTRT